MANLLFEKFMRAMMLVQQRVANFVSNIANGAEAVSSTFSTDGYSRITGHVRSDKALTLTVYQGDSSSGTMDCKTDVPVPASATEGAGAGFSVEVVGRYAKVKIANASGADTTTLNASVYLRSAS